jgi:hypothetical protein
MAKPQPIWSHWLVRKKIVRAKIFRTKYLDQKYLEQNRTKIIHFHSFKTRV